MSVTIPEDVIQAAQAAQAKYGVPACISLAQWALESGWGQHEPPGSNNPFGIKARLNSAGVPIEPFVESGTEEDNGGAHHITAPFRKFASMEDAFDYHASLLATGAPYAKAMKFENDPDAFANALTGVYATDPQYGAKLIAIIGQHALTQYDT